jgi:biotin carboxyl carrier protein
VRKKTIAAFACGALLVVVAGAQTFGGIASDSSAAPSDGTTGTESHTVVVTRGSISNVLSLDVDLITRPRYQVPAPLGGSFSPEVREGEMVDAGETIGVIRSEGKNVKIVAKARSRVSKILASSGETVPGGIAVVALQSRSFALQATVAPSDRYRLTALGADNKVRGSIDNGPGPFNCPLLGGPQQGEDGSLSVLCAVPEYVKVFAGLKGIMAISLEQRNDVLTLPISAVAGTAETGQVSLIKDSGKTMLKDVKLGITNGVQIEIRSGLSEDQRVTSRAPSLSSTEE